MRALEHDQQHQNPNHQEGVDRRHEDLAGLGFGGVLDVDARQKAQLHRLLRH